MKTFEQALLVKLQQHGLGETDCVAVYQEFLKDESLREFWTKERNRLKDDMDNYGPQSEVLLHIHWLNIKETAVNWIKSNCPTHFALALLSDEDPGKILSEQAKLVADKREKEGDERVPLPPKEIEDPDNLIGFLETRKKLERFQSFNVREPNLQQMPRCFKSK